MTVRVAWLYPGPAAGVDGQTREDTRLAPIGTMWPTGTMTTRSGLIPGGTPMVLTGTAMTATIGVGRAVVQGTTAQGAYAVAVTAPHDVTHDPGDAANPRVDVIALRVYDHVYDTEGQYIGDIVIVKGAPGPAPTPPAMPSPTTLPLYRVTVPAGASAGTGGLAWGAATDLRTFTTGLGGILPQDATNASGSYVGQYRDSAAGPERWDGTTWATPTGRWQAWTPSLTASTTSPTGLAVAGRYTVIGSTVIAQWSVLWQTGSANGSGIYGLSLPVPARRLSTGEMPLGDCQIVVSGTTYAGQLLGASGSGGVTSVPRIRLSDTAASGSANWSSTVPAAPTTATQATGRLTYEAA